jgi:hypothetical protein
MHRTRTVASAALLAGVATVGMAGVASAGTPHDDHGHDRGHDRTGLVSGVAQGVGGLLGGGVETVGNLLSSDIAGPLLDGVL